MMKNLSGDYETIDYIGNRGILLHNNTIYEDYPMHWHNAVEIIMPLTNDYHVECRNKEYILNERDILIIPAGELHHLYANEGRRLIIICDNTALSANPALSDLKALLSEVIFISSENYSQEFIEYVGKLISDIYTLYSNRKGLSDVFLYMKLINIFVKISEYHSENSDSDNIMLNQKFNFIIKYIDENYTHEITLDELAKVAGYSKYHFSRLFKKINSKTFVDLVNERRIRAAEMLLNENNLSITDIAMDSGFTSLANFNRVFKKIKGCSPSEYKKMYLDLLSSDVQTD